MEQLLTLILLDYRKSAKECSRRLEFEESSNTLAQIQGELSGCKLFLDTFENTFSSSIRYETLTIDEQKIPDFTKVTDKTLAALESQRMKLESNPYWEELMMKFKSHRENKKEWLFSSAEKGRDLVFAHGWRDALLKHKELCLKIEREYEYRREENQLFDDDLNLSEIDNIDILEIETQEDKNDTEN